MCICCREEKILNMSKEILFVTPIYEPANLSGSVVFVKELVNKFKQKDANITVLTTNSLNAVHWYNPFSRQWLKKGVYKENGVTVIRLGCNQFLLSIFFVLNKYFTKFLPLKVKNYLQLMSFGPIFLHPNKYFEKKYDVIHISTLPMGYNKQVIDVIKSTKINIDTKTILTPFFHAHVPGFKNPELKYIFNNVNLIHVLTDSELSSLVDTFKVPQEKLVKIPLFINEYENLETNLFKQKVSDLQNKHNLRDKKVILFAGNKGKMKGAIDLLAAVRELYKTDSTYRLLALGNAMPDWINSVKPSDSQFLIDLPYVTSTEDKLAIFSACDLFCMPSISESFGLVYIEAWYLKKPVIGANIQSVSEIFKDCGVLVEFGNVTELTYTIGKLFSEPFKMHDLGIKGHTRLMQNFTYKAVAKYYETLFGIS